MNIEQVEREFTNLLLLSTAPIVLTLVIDLCD